MSIFDFIDYKDYLNAWLENLPKKGHGEMRRMALHLNVSTTMMSQVLRGNKDFSSELASELADYLNLNDNETDYFFLMIDYARAGSHNLKTKLKKRLEHKKNESQKLVNRMPKDAELSEQNKAIYYSSWMYTGVRNLSAIPYYSDIDKISEKLNLPRNQIQKVVDFLIQNQLCVLKDGKLEVGPQKTHIGNNSLLVHKHHQNWRLQGFNKMVQSDDENLFYTAPMSLSKELASEIRQELPSIIEKIIKRVGPSESEVVRCLNIDWFEY